MADMHFEAAVIGGQRDAAGLRVGQVQDGVVQMREQRVAGQLVITLIVDGPIACRIDQQAQLRLRLAAPGGEQRLADLAEGGLAAFGQRSEAPGVDHVEPELAAGVDGVDVHVDHAAQGLQQA
jgi:hypothetical protein